MKPIFSTLLLYIPKLIDNIVGEPGQQRRAARRARRAKRKAERKARKAAKK